jgi:hypothetical protein
MGIIYGLLDPRTKELRYVGKTEGTLKKRLREHLSRARHGSRRGHVYAWLRAIDLNPLTEILEENLSGGDLDDAEKFWISSALSSGAKLVNHTFGGEGCKGYKHTEETRKKMSGSKAGKLRGPRYDIRKLTDSEVQKVVSLYSEGKSSRAIAEILGNFSQTGIRKVLAREGVQLRKAVVGRWLTEKGSK